MFVDLCYSGFIYSPRGELVDRRQDTALHIPARPAAMLFVVGAREQIETNTEREHENQVQFTTP